jgi:pimeloyl-ACP methyl ester carboxylesterase
VAAPDLVPAYRHGLDAAVDVVAGLVSPEDELCGLSLGGLVALHAARRVHVRRLIVCAAFDRLPATLRRGTRALAVVARAMPRRFLHGRLVAELPEAYRTLALDEIAPLRSAELSRLMWQAAGSVVDAEAITAPTIVVCGERDQANLPLCRALAERLPNATLEIVPEAGHVASLDNPDAFSALLSRA